MELETRRRDQRQEQQQQQQQRDAAAENGGQAMMSGQSYWLDLWLFVLFDLALFVVIYLLP